MNHFFYRVPNYLIRCECPNMKLICTCFLLDETRGLGNRGMTSVQYLINNCGYKQRKGSYGINSIYKKILQDLIENNVINLIDDSDSLPHSITTGIPYIINPDKFDATDNFTMLTKEEYDNIIRYNSDRNKEKLLTLYLYIKSFCYQVADNEISTGFYQGLDTVCTYIGLSKQSVIKLYNKLVEMELLYKYKVESLPINKKANHNPIYIPTIYIPNLGQSSQELNKIYKNTVNIMKKYYEAK